MQYIATQAHRSEFPMPITFLRGTLLRIQKKYEGTEDWSDWYFCTTADGQEGYVPAQVFERLDAAQALALEDYTARELDVAPGDVLSASRLLNGWAWCHRAADGTSGWVPLDVLALA